MTDLRQAAAAALEALERCRDWPGAYGECSRAVHSLRAALAEPDGEPVMWRNLDRKCVTHHQETAELWRQEGAKVLPLYTSAITPPAPLELTDEEIALLVGECAASAHRHDDFSFARKVIAAYKAKNGITGEQT